MILSSDNWSNPQKNSLPHWTRAICKFVEHSNPTMRLARARAHVRPFRVCQQGSRSAFNVCTCTPPYREASTFRTYACAHALRVPALSFINSRGAHKRETLRMSRCSVCTCMRGIRVQCSSAHHVFQDSINRSRERESFGLPNFMLCVWWLLLFVGICWICVCVQEVISACVTHYTFIKLWWRKISNIFIKNKAINKHTITHKFTPERWHRTII